MRKIIAMTSMELDDEEKVDCEMPIPMSEKPQYPYGLRICLTDKELEKLKLDSGEACVGGIIHLHALARITHVSCEEMQDGKRERIELQIEDMCVESEDDQNEEAARENRRSPLYAE